MMSYGHQANLFNNCYLKEKQLVYNQGVNNGHACFGRLQGTQPYGSISQKQGTLTSWVAKGQPGSR